jgi:hypothetical protein
MKSALLLLPFAAARLPLARDTSTTGYENFVAEFAPVHAGSEDVFRENLNKIIAHNLDNTQTYKMGVNKVCNLRRFH